MPKAGPQSGITNRPPEHLLLASFTFVEGQETRQSIELLRDLIAHELESRLSPENQDRTLPSAETGELGFIPGYDRAFLTITLGLSMSGVQKLGLPEPPADLRTIPWADLLDADKAPADTGGDLVLQICADNLYICEHVVRRVEEELGDRFTSNSAFIGSQRYSSRAGRTSRHEGRALIGFLDGTSNLDPAKEEGDAKLVFVDPKEVPNYPRSPEPGEQQGENRYGQPADPKPHFPDLHQPPEKEPDWTEHGTYMTVRVSTFDSAGWDKLAQEDQEATVGRFKEKGGSLDLPNDPASLDEPPAFAADKAAPGVAVNAHIRKANPRGQEDVDQQRRIFRRGYPLIGSEGGQLQRGLIFISFGRSITTQFEFIIRAWIRNNDFPFPGAGPDPLFAKVGERVLGGGYYFVPPLEQKTHPWTWKLPAA